MKTIRPIIFAAAMLLSALAHGETYGFTNSVGLTVPDANPTGLTTSTNLSGMAGIVTSVSVTLNITGGFNGDLYAYLVDPSANLVVLLNRSGVGSGNPLGYSDAGFNIVLSSSGAGNIHNYQSGSPAFVGGQLTGTWLPDGRAIDPQSDPSLFDTASTSPDLTLFNNLNPNGQWTLFIADLSGGGESTLASWGLTIITVPEPQTWAMVVGGLGVLLMMNRRRTR